MARLANTTYIVTAGLSQESFSADPEVQTKTRNFISPDIFPKYYDVPTSNTLLRQALYKAFGGKCFHTGRDVSFDKMHIDHIIPKSQGGPDNIYNYVLCDPDMNLKKSDKVHNPTVERTLDFVRTTFAPLIIAEMRRTSRSFASREKLTSTIYNPPAKFNSSPPFGNSWIETARHIKSLIDERGVSGNHLSKELGMSQSKLSRILKLLNLPESIQEGVHNGIIPISLAREIIKLKSPNKQLKMANDYVSGNLNLSLATAQTRKASGNAKLKTQTQWTTNGITISISHKKSDTFEQISSALKELASILALENGDSNS